MHKIEKIMLYSIKIFLCHFRRPFTDVAVVPALPGVAGNLLKSFGVREAEPVFRCVGIQPFSAGVPANSSVMDPKSTVVPSWCWLVPGRADTLDASASPISLTYLAKRFFWYS